MSDKPTSFALDLPAIRQDFPIRAFTWNLPSDFESANIWSSFDLFG